MTGRAWPSNGAGGTLNASGNEPGPYYVLATAEVSAVGSAGFAAPDILHRAVAYGVRSIQRALNRQLGGAPFRADGVFGEKTSEATKTFQRKRNLTADGVVGPQTARALFTPVVRRLATVRVPACALEGQVQNESGFDPGAVGYVDDRDLGLMQINGRWHPEFDESERFSPIVAVDYAIELYNNALSALGGNLEDAVAAYNLGIGGARTWIEHGRPDVIDYYERPVEIRAYIDRILSGCQ